MPSVDDHSERLNEEVSLQRLLEARGTALTQRGDLLVGLCPFHTDTEPRLTVDPATNTWTCTGACNAGGTVIDFVMRAEGVSRRHAVELLTSGEALGMRSESGRGRSNDAPVQHSTVRRLPSPVDADTDDAQMLAQVVAYYHKTLKQTPEALAYLEKRGLGAPELIDHFKLGYSNRSLGLRLPLKNRDAGMKVRSRLQALGVFRDTGHEHFRGSLAIPVFDATGSVVQIYGRKTIHHLRHGSPMHTYLDSTRRGVWNLEGIAGSATVILCQSLIDGLTYWSHGYRNVTACFGPEAFGDEHLGAFKATNVSKVVLAFRRGGAGDAGAEAVAAKLVAQGIDCFQVQLPVGQDVNEFALGVREPGKALGEVTRHAIWLGSGRPATTLEIAALPATLTRTEHVGPAPSIESALVKAAEGGKPATHEDSIPAQGRPTARRARLQRPPPTRAPAADPPPAEPETSPAREPIEPEPVNPDLPVEIGEAELTIRLGDRRYRVRGLEKNTAYDVMKVNLLCSRHAHLPGPGFHVDTLDLYAARQRAAFVKQAALELGVAEEVIRHDLGRVLFKLEALQAENIKKVLEPETKAVSISDDDQAAALALLRDPQLLDRVLHDFRRLGVVGEETNLLMGYLASISRKLDDPLAVVIQSSSAAGKTSLMEAVLALVPEEDRVKYSAMTGQSLFYMGETNLQHRVLAIAEEEGAQRASYALKLLQSEGEITIASTGKDPGTGRLVSQEYRVVGPVQLFLTTTAIDIDEELMNRCVVLTVDEDREQTRAIHRVQRERQTLEGYLSRQQRRDILRLHQNAQRLLRPLPVINPWARHLTFLDDRTRTRRDHTKYLGLIRAIALLHQHQRPVKQASQGERSFEYIEVTPEDIATANRLSHQLLGESLDDLPPQTRRLLMTLEQAVSRECAARALIRSDYRFTRREARLWSGWTDFQVRTHLARLVSLEYVLVHRGSRGRTFEYELLYDGQGQDGRPFVPGLIDASKLTQHQYGANVEGPGGAFERPSSHQRAPVEPASSVPPELKFPSDDGRVRGDGPDPVPEAHPGDTNPEPASQVPDHRSPEGEP